MVGIPGWCIGGIYPGGVQGYIPGYSLPESVINPGIASLRVLSTAGVPGMVGVHTAGVPGMVGERHIHQGG